MFFAALFAMYFTIRSVDKGSGLPWPGAHLDIALGSVNTTVLLLSSVTCQMGVFAVERGQIRRTRSVFHPMSWGLREWYVLSFLMGLYFVCGQGYEYLDLIRKQGLTLSSSAYGSVFYMPTGFHGLHVAGGLDRVHLPARPHLRRQDDSPMNSRSAPSSCRTTGTSSTSCGSACSPPSTSSTSQGTASELDQRQAQAPGRRLRGPAARARHRHAALRRLHRHGRRRAGPSPCPSQSDINAGQTCSRRTARAATASMRRAPPRPRAWLARARPRSTSRCPPAGCRPRRSARSNGASR